jgi:hypothetical protein
VLVDGYFRSLLVCTALYPSLTTLTHHLTHTYTYTQARKKVEESYMDHGATGVLRTKADKLKRFNLDEVKGWLCVL